MEGLPDRAAQAPPLLHQGTVKNDQSAPDGAGRSFSYIRASALRELERDGLVTRREYLEVPVRVEYGPTDSCRELLPILEQLSDWAEARM